MQDLGTFFSRHTSEAYIIYGFSSLGLAIAVAIQPRSSKTSFEKHLWLIGLFGLLMGAKQFVEWIAYSYSDTNQAALGQLSDLLLYGSYIAIFGYGWNSSIELCPFRGTARRLLPLGAFALAALVVAGCAIAAADPQLGFRAGMRVAVGIPGFAMTGLALLDFTRQHRTDTDFTAATRGATLLAAAGFISHGLLSFASQRVGIAVLDWIPDSEDFEAVFVVPIRIVRAGSLLLITLGLGILLRDLNAISRRRKAQAQLELRQLTTRLSEKVAERTEALQLANDELERQLAVQQRTEAELRASEARFRLTLAVTRQGLFDIDLLSDTTTVSPEYATILGHDPKSFTESLRRWLARTHPDDRRRVATEFDDNIRGDRPYFHLEFRQRTPAGEWRWILARLGALEHNAEGKAVRVLGTITDITDRRGFEQRLLRTERLESIGALAGGIAHDFNNALVPIVAGTALLRPTASKDDLALLEAMEAGASRATAMVKQLLSFARGTGGRQGAVGVLALFAEMEKLMRSTFPKRIQIHTLCHNPDSVIAGDSTQLHQVLLNLCVNARDAMPHGGMLALESDDVAVDPATAAGHHDVRPGQHVRIVVSDTGSGIPPEVLKNIFKPFFTTKGPDKGTGLGLSTVEEIVRAHHGFIELKTEAGKGTRFIIYLPKEAGAAGGEASVEAVQALPVPDGRGRRLLIVDDEAMIADIVRFLLRDSGFEFETAQNGIEALAWLDEYRDGFALLLVDLNMPTMDGLEFLRSARERHPGVPVVAMSGNVSQRSHIALSELQVAAVLAKPFDRQSLFAAMHKAWSAG